MDARRLVIFRAVARAGSIGAGARELGWTQPAVSQHLQHLEREVGAALLLRGPHGVDLTEAGRALLVHADAVAAHLRAARDELDDLAQLRAGSVRVAAFPSAAATLLPAALAAVHRRSPGVTVSFAEAEPPEADAMVRSGDVDLALVFTYDATVPDVPDLVWHPLTTDPIRLVVPPDHAGVADAPAAMADLAGDVWVAGCVRCSANLVRTCRDAGFDPAIRHVTDDYVAAQSLVAAGLGVTLLPDLALRAFRHPGVAVLDVPGPGSRVVGVTHRPGAERVHAVAAMLTALGV